MVLKLINGTPEFVNTHTTAQQAQDWILDHGDSLTDYMVTTSFRK